jgi:hypothetical protein
MCKFMRFYAILRSQYKGEFAKKSSNITRARDELTKFKNAFLAYARKYRAARTALLRLDPDGEWKKRFQELKNDQLKGPYIWDDQSDLGAMLDQRNRELGGGHYTPAWFWTLNLGADGRRTEPIDQIRVQWAKLMAHAERWEEEECRVPEEMRCTLATFECEQREWLERVGKRADPCRPWLQACLDAYAHRQAALRIARRDQYAADWVPLLQAAGAGKDWIAQYEHLVPAELPKRARARARAGVRAGALAAARALDDAGGCACICARTQ